MFRVVASIVLRFQLFQPFWNLIYVSQIWRNMPIDFSVTDLGRYKYFKSVCRLEKSADKILLSNNFMVSMKKDEKCTKSTETQKVFGNIFLFFFFS